MRRWWERAWTGTSNDLVNYWAQWQNRWKWKMKILIWKYFMLVNNYVSIECGMHLICWLLVLFCWLCFCVQIFWGPILMNVCGFQHYMAYMRGHRKMEEEQGDGGSEKRYRQGGLLAIEWNGQIDQRWWLVMKVPIPNFLVIQTIMRTLDIEWVWYVDWCCHFVDYVLACWISWECWLMMTVWDLQYMKAWLRGCQKTR